MLRGLPSEALFFDSDRILSTGVGNTLSERYQ